MDHVKKNGFEPQSHCVGKRVLLMCMHVSYMCMATVESLLIVGTSVHAVWD